MNYLIVSIVYWCYKNKDKIPQMYRIGKIPKRNGQFRTLEIPDAGLAHCQKVIKEEWLDHLECSDYAVAYRKGKNIKNTLFMHENQRLVLKLDIKNFFGSITENMVKNKVFNCESGDVLTKLCCFNNHLPQGACTSPVISNLVMKDFDEKLGEFCKKRHIRFCRYSDDMIFSGDFNPGEIIREVRKMLKEMNMELNAEKTVIASKGSQQKVLGVVVNEKMQLSSDYRRKIRQEIYYCNKYGVKNHIINSNNEKYIARDEKNNIRFVDTEGYVKSLAGKISYALFINPRDLKMSEYESILLGLKS